MDCLRCNNEAIRGKALCANCLAGKPVLSQDTKKVQTAILKVRETQRLVSELTYAGFWLRFMAVIIDGFLLGVIQHLVWTAIFSLLDPNTIMKFIFSPVTTADPVKLVISSLKGMVWFYLAPVLLYYGIFESSRLQSTPGKAILALKVTDQDGVRPNFFKAFIRALSRFSNLVSIVPGIIMILSSSYITLASILLALGTSIFFIPFSYAMAGFTAQKQALHDKIAGTLVIRSTSFNKKRVIIAAVLILWIFVYSFISVYRDDQQWQTLCSLAAAIWKLCLSLF